MGDMADAFQSLNARTRQRKDERRAENLQYLADHAVPWAWVDKVGDHILIRGEIDYYLGKTYWHNRTTGKKGYAMIQRLKGSGDR